MNEVVATSNLVAAPYVVPAHTAANSPLFWALIAAIVIIITLLALREFFCWYFKINELNSNLSRLVEQLGTTPLIPTPAGRLMVPTGSTRLDADHTAALILAALKHLGKI